MKGCIFCEAGLPILEGYHQVGVYHKYSTKLKAYPKCGHAFTSVKIKHPFVPSVGKAECDFCGQAKYDSIHKD